MEDKLKKYLNKVVELLVDDTEISNEVNDKSFKPSFTSIWFDPVYLKHKSDRLLRGNFFTYCKDMYGLTGREIEYVWEQYKSTVRDKFKNGR
jgi:hypothetical protein